MGRQDCMLKTVRFYVFTQADYHSDIFVLALYHMQNCLENEDIFHFHFFYLDFKARSQFCAILKLRKLNHFSLFYVDSQASCLINDVRIWHFFTFIFAEFCDVVHHSHKVQKTVNYTPDSIRQSFGFGLLKNVIHWNIISISWFHLINIKILHVFVQK